MIQKTSVKERFQHPKTSKLKDPRLRKIRKNLRDLIVLATLDEMHRLAKLERLYSEKREKKWPLVASQWKKANIFTDDIEKFLAAQRENKELEKKMLVPSQWKRETELHHKQLDLYDALNRSICLCASFSNCKTVSELRKQGINTPEYFTDLDLIWDSAFKKWYCEKCFYLVHPPSEKNGLDK